MTGLATIYIGYIEVTASHVRRHVHISSTSPPDNFRMWGKWIYRIIVLIQKVFSVKYVLRTRPHAAATNRSPFGSFAVWQWTKPVGEFAPRVPSRIFVSAPGTGYLLDCLPLRCKMSTTVHNVPTRCSPKAAFTTWPVAKCKLYFLELGTWNRYRPPSPYWAFPIVIWVLNSNGSYSMLLWSSGSSDLT